jgi:hypothetical protein
MYDHENMKMLIAAYADRRLILADEEGQQCETVITLKDLVEFIQRSGASASRAFRPEDWKDEQHDKDN